ncbi:MAG: hypothetical protein ABR567_12535 [Myxococcales bacterium]|nr:hypothetical protein [Myxococcales bacterium]
MRSRVRVPPEKAQEANTKTRQLSEASRCVLGWVTMRVMSGLLALAVAGSIRAVGSLGAGDLGISSYFGLEGEGWLTENFALGARVVKGSQSTLTFLGPSRTRDAVLVEAEALTGVHFGRSSLVAGFGVGSASVEERSTSGLCLTTCPAPPRPLESSPVTGSLFGGAIAHFSHFAFALTGRLQFLGNGWELLGTIGLGLAF